MAAEGAGCGLAHPEDGGGEGCQGQGERLGAMRRSRGGGDGGRGQGRRVQVGGARGDRSEGEDAGAPEAAGRGGAPPVLEAERWRREREGRERRVSVSSLPSVRRPLIASSRTCLRFFWASIYRVLERVRLGFLVIRVVVLGVQIFTDEAPVASSCGVE